MNILITGGAGFIGSHLCEKLFEQGHAVTIMDSLSAQIHPEWEGSFLQKKTEGKCILIKGDVRKREDWINALKGMDAIVHLAAETGTGQSMYEVERYYETNVQGTALLLDVLVNQKHTIKKIILASTRALYGEGKYQSETLGIVYPESRNFEQMEKGIFDLLSPDTGQPMKMLLTDESSALHPSSVYGLTKLAQEQMLMLMGKQLNIPCVALRLQNVYGPGQSLFNPYTGLLAVFSTRIRNGNLLEIYEDGNETRDFVYIDDVVNAFLLAIEKEEANHQIFNVGSGNHVSILRIAELLAAGFGKEVKTSVTGKFRVGDIRHNCADTSTISRVLGFKPTVTIEEGLCHFADWVSQQKTAEDQYERSVNEMKEKGVMK